MRRGLRIENNTLLEAREFTTRQLGRELLTKELVEVSKEYRDIHMDIASVYKELQRQKRDRTLTKGIDIHIPKGESAKVYPNTDGTIDVIPSDRPVISQRGTKEIVILGRGKQRNSCTIPNNNSPKSVKNYGVDFNMVPEIPPPAPRVSSPLSYGEKSHNFKEIRVQNTRSFESLSKRERDGWDRRELA